MIEDKACCPGCGRTLHRRPYLMAQRSETPVIPWPWALVLLAVLLVACLLIARAL